jgi:hypothetical protein
LAGKRWLEIKPNSSLPKKEKEPPKPPITKNFPQLKNPNSDIIKDKSIIIAKKPDNKDNLPLTTQTEKNLTITNYRPESITNEIPPTPSKISEQLPTINNSQSNKEQFLLAKIKQLEEKLMKAQVENNHLKTENNHLKKLILKDQENEAKIIQLLTFKEKR